MESNDQLRPWCIACAGVDDLDFDYCRACGRGEELPAPAIPIAETDLGRAIRLARGLASDDVEGTIGKWSNALKSAERRATASPPPETTPDESAAPVDPHPREAFQTLPPTQPKEG